MEKLLYYPYVNLPRSTWTARSLLYYDQIGAIVPSHFFHNPTRSYNQFMLQLVRENLVIPIDPFDTIGNIKSFLDPLFSFFISEDFELEQKVELFSQSNDRYLKIYDDKFGYHFLNKLKNIGLARKISSKWYDVETSTAQYLMAYLATGMAMKLNMLPGTDKLENIVFLDSDENSNHDSKRTYLLNELIPFPTNFEFYEIKKFKDKYHEELHDFRNIIEQIVLDTSYDHHKLLELKVEELKSRRESLSKKMNESKLGEIFFGSICGVTGASIGIAQADTSLALVGALPGFISALHSAFKIQRIDDIEDQSGMKYIALLDKKVSNKFNAQLSFNFNN